MITQEFVDPAVASSEGDQSIAVPLSWVVAATAPAELSGTQFLVHLSNGTGDFRVLLYTSGTTLRMQARQSAFNAADFAIGSLSPGELFRCACRWASGDFGGSLDGATAVTSGGSFSATEYTVYHFGSSTGGTVQWGGSIQLVQEYDSALTNEEIETLSLGGSMPAYLTAQIQAIKDRIQARVDEIDAHVETVPPVRQDFSVRLLSPYRDALAARAA